MQDGLIYSFSEAKMPLSFLRPYFEQERMENEAVYRLVSRTHIDTAKMILELVSLRQDTQALRSNCCKLLGLSEFAAADANDVFLEIVCPSCRAEGVLRPKCIKCYSPYPKELVVDVAMEHLKYLQQLQLTHDSYCDKCKGINERKLSDFCRCGGTFKRRNHWGEVLKLMSRVKSRVLDEVCGLLPGHFTES
jgi:DNA polymerase epsilon subunit 1